MMNETKDEATRTDKAQPQDEGPELVVQQLFFEDYGATESLPDELDEVEQPERKSLVKRIAKSAFLGLLMIGGLLFGGIALAGSRRRTSRLASLRRRFIH